MLDPELDADVSEAPELDILVCGALTLDAVGIADTLSDSGAVTMLTQMHTGLGGRGANFAAFAQSLGAKASLLAPVGLEQQRARHHCPTAEGSLHPPPPLLHPHIFLHPRAPKEFIFIASFLARTTMPLSPG